MASSSFRVRYFLAGQQDRFRRLERSSVDSEDHPGHGQRLRRIETECDLLVHLVLREPYIVVFLRTEEVHDVSGGACPVVEPVQIDVQNANARGHDLGELSLLDSHRDPLPALAAPGFDFDVLLDGCDVTLDMLTARVWDRRGSLTRQEKEEVARWLGRVARYRANWPRRVDSHPDIATVQERVDRILEQFVDDTAPPTEGSVEPGHAREEE